MASDMKGKSPALDGIELVAMCDIDNPMHGPQGAAWIFAPQKGADPQGVERLDTQSFYYDGHVIEIRFENSTANSIKHITNINQGFFINLNL